MKTIQSLTLIILIAAVILASCKKDEEDNSVTIEVISPSSTNPMFDHGDKMHIHTIIKSNDLHDVSLVIKNTTKDSIEYEFSDHSHEVEYVIHKDYTFEVDDHTDYVVTITGSNHAGEKESAEFFPHVMPEEE